MNNNLNRGITIIALIITIIVMLILAGVTINLTMGENGIFIAALEAKEKQKISEYKDKVELARASVAINNMGEVTLDNLILEIYKEKIVPENTISKTDEEKAQMITKEGYIFIITVDKIEYVEKGEKIDTVEPESAIITSGPVDSSKSVTLTASGTDNESGIASYEIYVNGTKVSTTNTYTITNMPFNTSYSYYVIVTDKAGNSKQSETGTVSNTQYISNVTDLKNLALAVNSGNSFSNTIITQTTDISLGCNSTNQWVPIGNGGDGFAGIYDGNNKTISDIYIDSDEAHKGLFGIITGTVKNTRLTSGTIKGKGVVGGIVGLNYGNIINCANNANIIGKLEQTGNAHIGGIAGLNYSAITGCCNTGNISDDKATTVWHSAIGGIVGYGNGTIENCYNTGTIDGGVAGGIISEGVPSQVIKNCYNVGSVIGRNNAAGIAYRYEINELPAMTNCYYLDTCGAAGLGTSSTSVQLKALASTLGSTFKTDSNNVNNGYPILNWQ